MLKESLSGCCGSAQCDQHEAERIDTLVETLSNVRDLGAFDGNVLMIFVRVVSNVMQ